ncbi:hypothetical protein JFU49_10255 [Pseudomonas sp. TH03]|uniref:hypothetical protein n=1 Tax=Pseudomonas sp. TH03 TaxID=2796369 RepID=UPI001911FECA|nr:hypothetical protein [Pseudomonas sp. TH03]MBK5550650.1 hypothetical protein [Pseudomonas sp. TH03]
MKITGKVEVEAVMDVVCDVCQLSTRVATGGLQFAMLQAHWGYGTKHDGERYELHLCEDCFFQTIDNLKQERRTQCLLSDDGRADTAMAGDDFGLITKDVFFGDGR